MLKILGPWDGVVPVPTGQVSPDYESGLPRCHRFERDPKRDAFELQEFERYLLKLMHQ